MQNQPLTCQSHESSFIMVGLTTRFPSVVLLWKYFNMQDYIIALKFETHNVS